MIISKRLIFFSAVTLFIQASNDRQQTSHFIASQEPQYYIQTGEPIADINQLKQRLKEV